MICQRPLEAPALLSGALPIEAPLIANAGEQIEITIGPVPATNGTRVGLVMTGTHGPRIYNTQFESGMAHFVIPADDTRQPGYLALVAAADDARGEHGIVVFSRRTFSVYGGPALESPL